MRVFGKDGDAPSAKEYEELAELTRKVAKKYNVTPSHMQAALWVGIKAMEGDPSDTPEPFENTLAKFKAHQDDQGQIDFEHAESKYEKIENELAKERSNPPEPSYKSPTVYGPRLAEIADKEAGYPKALVDLICDAPPGLMMAAILFCRKNAERWQEGKGDPVAELEADLAKIEQGKG